MFETKKTLIVVYKDELVANQLKKMVETNDDTDDEVIGTRDESINIVSWTEKVWLQNKKAGNIQGKILFLGNVKGTDKLIPVIDVKYDEFGVQYGWAGNQGIVFADPKKLATRADYDAFLEKLSAMPVPASLKPSKDAIVSGEIAEKENAPEEAEFAEDEMQEKPKFWQSAKSVLDQGAKKVSSFGSQVAVKTEELFRDRSLMTRQMLFYGVISLYHNDLDKFLNM